LRTISDTSGTSHTSVPKPGIGLLVVTGISAGLENVLWLTWNATAANDGAGAGVHAVGDVIPIRERPG